MADSVNVVACESQSAWSRDIYRCSGACLGEESATSASQLHGKIECIIMQSAMAIIALRRSISGKRIVKGSRARHYLTHYSRSVVLSRIDYPAKRHKSRVPGCGCTCMTCRFD